MRQFILDQPARVCEWVCERLPQMKDTTPFTCIGIEDKGRLIAGVIFDGFTGTDINITIALEKGRIWRQKWMFGVFAYVFTQLQCQRCSVDVADDNAASIAFIEHLGFVKEGVKRCSLPGGIDSIVYGMLRGECRYLRMH